VRRSVWLTILLVGTPAAAWSQDSVRVTPTDTVAVLPTAGRPTTPTGAMFRSFLIPGWGQASYGRKVTAGIMLGVEGLSLGMILKVKSEQAYIEDTGSDRWRKKRQEQEDWITILVFNHLMSGLEAYVSSHLYDFPGDLEMRALPSGGMRVGVSLPLGPR
jgi:hypothetical protein